MGKDTSLKFSSKSFYKANLFRLFFIDIFVFLISFLSLGILFPFAYDIRVSYVLSNSIIDGEKIEFKADGIFIFKKYLVWILLGFLTLGLYFISIRNKFTIFAVSNSVFIDENDKEEKAKPPFIFLKNSADNNFIYKDNPGICRFYGRALTRFGIDICSILITLGSGFILFPVCYCWKKRFIINHSIINSKQLSFKEYGFNLIPVWILLLLLTILTLGIGGMFASKVLYSYVLRHTTKKEVNK